MYAEGTLDLMMMVAVAAFKPPEEKEESLASVVKKAKTRHFPVFEKVGCGDPVWPRQGGPGGGQRQLGAQILQGSRAGLTSTRVTLPSPRPPSPGGRTWGRGLHSQLVPWSPSQAAAMGDSDIPYC